LEHWSSYGAQKRPYHLTSRRVSKLCQQSTFFMAKYTLIILGSFMLRFFRELPTSALQSAWGLRLDGLGEKSAVYPEINAGDESAGFFARQEDRGADEFRRISETPHRRMA
jgi:hypothetical protein